MTWNDVIKLITVFGGAGSIIAGVGGLFIWIFKQWITNSFSKKLKEQELRINEEIRKTELQLSKRLTLEQKHFDIKIESYRNSWNKLVELEEYVISDFPNYISNLKPKNTNEYVYPLRKKCHDIRKEILFLPKTHHILINDLIDQLFNDISIFIQQGEELAKNIKPDKEGRKISNENDMMILNKALNDLQSNIHNKVNQLRESFQESYLSEINSK